MGYSLKSSVLAICLLAISIPLSAQRGADTVPRSLDVLVDRAQTIVHGHVLSARVEPHPQLTNLQTVVIELKVDEVLKGKTAGTMTFRQYVWDVRDRYDSAGYAKGLELLLLLNPTSEYGLTSPTGMGQGRFRIIRQGKSKVLAVNEVGNLGLFHGTAQAASRKGITLSPRVRTMVAQSKQGPVALDDLEQFIRTWNAGARGK